jgi:hypothetical protein
MLLPTYAARMSSSRSRSFDGSSLDGSLLLSWRSGGCGCARHQLVTAEITPDQLVEVSKPLRLQNRADIVRDKQHQ